MAPTLIDLPNELLHQILEVRGTRLPGVPLDRKLLKLGGEAKRKAGMLLSLRATCRQLHAAYEEIFTTAFCEHIAFQLTPKHLVVASAFANNPTANCKPKTLAIMPPPTITSGQRPSAYDFLVPVSQFRNLRILILCGGTGFDNETLYSRFLSGIEIGKLWAITFKDVTLKTSELIPLIRRLRSLGCATFKHVDLIGGTWEDVFTAFRKSRKLRYLRIDHGTQQGVPLWKKAPGKGNDYSVDLTHTGIQKACRLILQENRSIFSVDSRQEALECLELMQALYCMLHWHHAF